ncbi:MAG: hypothetical protein QOG04_1319 [Actinomycetota bacterium]|jgi:hypothetical protein|nr:hypothetical protein [Actinomycetota bacterium]
MIGTLVIGVLAVAALAFVAAPLRRTETHDPGDPTSELENKKLVALTAILDLESERDVGKLSEEDFRELRTVYETEALDALHELDAMADPDVSDPLEAEIALVRARMGARRCRSCGAERKPGAAPCPACGA